MFVETSAQSGENIEQAFSLLTNSIINKVNTGEIGLDQVTAKQSFSSGRGLESVETS